jgi:hypothetical protein
MAADSAFSSEVDTGSREENALFERLDASFRSKWIEKRYGVFSSEVDAGSREENALFERLDASFRSDWIGKRYTGDYAFSGKRKIKQQRLTSNANATGQIPKRSTLCRGRTPRFKRPSGLTI